MGFWALVIATVLYIIVGVDNGLKRDWPHCGMWISYACANLFMIAYELTKVK
jgi:hypothetical protein